VFYALIVEVLKGYCHTSLRGRGVYTTSSKKEEFPAEHRLWQGRTALNLQAKDNPTETA
jgi:hypothetical protein